jgi:hypothetical protein
MADRKHHHHQRRDPINKFGAGQTALESLGVREAPDKGARQGAPVKLRLASLKVILMSDGIESVIHSCADDTDRATGLYAPRNFSRRHGASR